MANLIPFSDSVRRKQFPWVNLLLIIANLVVFFFELSLGAELDSFIQQWGVIPANIVGIMEDLSQGDKSPLVTLITAQFIHAGWLHVLGNLLFLWIFGDNVEDRLGHFSYLVFYLLAGTGAVLIQVFTASQSLTPLVGASGAIAAVLGAYLITYPSARVSVLIPFFVLFLPLEIPVIIMLGFWFISQLATGLAAITDVSMASGGVAWWAHIGGFVIGMIAILLWPKPRMSRAPMGSRIARSARHVSPALSFVLGVISLAGDVVKLLVLARVIFRLFDLSAAGPFGLLIEMIYLWTAPLVQPFTHILPTQQIGSFLVEWHSVLALLAYHVLATLAIWAITLLFTSESRPRAYR
jgi:membrane associated rhomboid family serine protease